MHISYRAIKEPSKLVRRLRYVSQTLRLAGQRPLNKDALVAKLRDWSRTHNDDLANYKHNTGAAHSTKKKRMTLLVINYLDLTVKFGLLSKISNVYQLTRTGRVLLSLLNDKPNEEINSFFLCEDERLFYIYQILQQDADVLLTVVNMIQLLENPLLENPTHKNLQNNFQQAFLDRLKAKISVSSQEQITNRLHDRRVEVTTEWKKPESYAAYIVPPRLHWLLDLGLLDSAMEKKNFIYEFTEVGQNFIKTLPKLAKSHIPEVPDPWFNTHFFQKSVHLSFLKLVVSQVSIDSYFEKWYAVCHYHKSFQLESVMPAKRYPVLLDSEQRASLITLTTSGTASARKLTHARILLKADAGEFGPAFLDKAIKAALDVSLSTIQRVRKTFVLEGLEAALLPRSPSQGARPRKFDGEKEVHLIALACSDPPEGHACWTLRLLAEKMVELQHFSSISHESIRQVLKKTSCVPGVSSAGVSQQKLRRHS